jgi:hypothetical protein
MPIGAAKNVMAVEVEEQQVEHLLLLQFEPMRMAIHFICVVAKLLLLQRKLSLTGLINIFVIVTDGLLSFEGLDDAGFSHKIITTGGGPESGKIADLTSDR